MTTPKVSPIAHEGPSPHAPLSPVDANNVDEPDSSAEESRYAYAEHIGRRVGRDYVISGRVIA